MDKIMMPPPIEIEIEDMDGKKIILTAVTISRKTLREINKISAKADDPENKENDGVLGEQMAVFFGGKPSDYDNIDLRVIRQVLERVTEEFKGKSNPM